MPRIRMKTSDTVLIYQKNKKMQVENLEKINFIVRNHEKVRYPEGKKIPIFIFTEKNEDLIENITAFQ